MTDARRMAAAGGMLWRHLQNSQQPATPSYSLEAFDPSGSIRAAGCRIALAGVGDEYYGFS